LEGKWTLSIVDWTAAQKRQKKVTLIGERVGLAPKVGYLCRGKGGAGVFSGGVNSKQRPDCGGCATMVGGVFVWWVGGGPGASRSRQLSGKTKKGLSGAVRQIRKNKKKGRKGKKTARKGLSYLGGKRGGCRV